EFAMGMLSQIDEEPEYLNRILFSDESTFHVPGKVNRHNVRIWGTENPHEVKEHERDSPKVNVWCGLMHDHVVGPFFFAEPTINMNTYLDMLRNLLSHRCKTCNQTSSSNRMGLRPIGDLSCVPLWMHIFQTG